jgi:transposase InsO family protein
MRIGEDLRRKVIELDRCYRSTWDAHAIAHVVGISATTVAKILREVRGPRPKRAKQPHTRRTKFTRRDVMWSSDFMELGWGWLLLTTLDEMSGYVLGWDLVRNENALAVIAHAESILERMGRAPLVWKYDHGSAFTSEIFQGLLEEHQIVPYPIAPRSPWVNGRKERDHQEVHNWLIPLAGRDVSREELEREIDEEMLVRNFIKPRACLGFGKSAAVYFSADAALEASGEVRGWLAQGLIDEKCTLGVPDPEEVYEIKKSGERLHRRAVRQVLQKLGLYEEWDTAVPGGPSEDETVNRSGPAAVSF